MSQNPQNENLPPWADHAAQRHQSCQQMYATIEGSSRDQYAGPLDAHNASMQNPQFANYVPVQYPVPNRPSLQEQVYRLQMHADQSDAKIIALQNEVNSLKRKDMERVQRENEERSYRGTRNVIQRDLELLPLDVSLFEAKFENKVVEYALRTSRHGNTTRKVVIDFGKLMRDRAYQGLKYLEACRLLIGDVLDTIIPHDQLHKYSETTDPKSYVPLPGTLIDNVVKCIWYCGGHDFIASKEPDDRKLYYSLTSTIMTLFRDKFTNARILKKKQCPDPVTATASGRRRKHHTMRRSDFVESESRGNRNAHRRHHSEQRYSHGRKGHHDSEQAQKHRRRKESQGYVHRSHRDTYEYELTNSDIEQPSSSNPPATYQSEEESDYRDSDDSASESPTVSPVQKKRKLNRTLSNSP